MSALFDFEHVRVARGPAIVLEDITASIAGEGITALVGPSGAGKSTMLRCCNRLDSPSGGRVLFRGTDLATLDPLVHRTRVAMVFQTPITFAGSVLANLRAGRPDLERQEAVQLLVRVGLPDSLLDREADTLSGGEAQRLCLGRALATRPEVVLADEPTSSLDDDSSAVLEGLARRLADAGTPIVWVTHDRAQVRRLADRVVALERGRIAYLGPVAGYDDARRRDPGP